MRNVYIQKPLVKIHQKVKCIKKITPIINQDKRDRSATCGTVRLPHHLANRRWTMSQNSVPELSNRRLLKRELAVIVMLKRKRIYRNHCSYVLASSQMCFTSHSGAGACILSLGLTPSMKNMSKLIFFPKSLWQPVLYMNRQPSSRIIADKNFSTRYSQVFSWHQRTATEQSRWDRG